MRPLRATVPERAFYHVMSRALEKRPIFDALASEMFRRFLRQVEAFAGVKVVTYCVMSNHFHILLQVPKRQAISDEEMFRRLEQGFSPAACARFQDQWNRQLLQGNESGLDALRQGVLQRMYDLSFFMKELKQRFSTWHNQRHSRKGPVWEDRFKSTLIENKPGYLATAAAYIDLNPVRAKLVKDPKEHRFCGYAEALAGETNALDGLREIAAMYGNRLDAEWVLETYRMLLFGKGEGKETKPGFTPEAVAQVFAEKGALKPWEQAGQRLRWLTDGAVIGSKAYVEDLRLRLHGKLGIKGIPRVSKADQTGTICTLRAWREE